MQLSGKRIVEEGIITGYCEEGIQQQGLDVRVIGINKLVGSGEIPSGRAKTHLPTYEPVGLYEGEWLLSPGYYEILLEEGCKMPDNRAMTFVQRSSALRCGAVIRSSQFDAGFETDHMGTFMMVFHPVIIEKGARIAQAIVVETDKVASEDLYAGQFQKDQQRGNAQGRF